MTTTKQGDIAESALLLSPIARAVRQHKLLHGSAVAVVSVFISAPVIAAESSNQVLEEVVVTARKREQQLQDVPISISVLNNQQLEELNIANFDDYVLFMPNVSWRSTKPGEASIYIRGIASGADGNASGQLPSVAVYLDDQPATAIGRNLDVHIYDIARIETLLGPQGTLFGASSQSGNLRIITNKPRLNEFEAGYDIGAETVTDGDTGHSFEGFVNLPVGDKAAIRLVGWIDKDAGYIDNIAATRTYAYSGITIDNDNYVESDINEATNSGLRAALKIDLNDSWTITPSAIHQELETDGIWDHDPEDVGDLKVERYGVDSGEDEWTQFGLSVEGNVGSVDLIYSGSYLDRDVEYVNDYSSYVDWGAYVEPWYTCYYTNVAGVCDDPTIRFEDHSDYERETHEIRLQSSQDGRLRWIVGAFYQKSEHKYDQEWHIPAIHPTAAIDDDNYYTTDQVRVDKEKALFGEVEFDFNDKLTGTFGGRFFDNETTLEGFTGTIWWPNCCFDRSNNVDSEFSKDDNTLKVNLAYEVDDQQMVYVTWSEGYRPGGVNRDTTALGETYDSDFVTNYEFGWKTSLLEGTLRFNGAIYFMEWDDFQFTKFDPAISLLGLTANVGQAESTGIEFDTTWLPTDDLRLSFALSYNQAELTDDYYRSPADEIAGTPQATDGTELPSVPDVQFTFVGRYNFDLLGMDAYGQLTHSYTDESWNDLFVASRELQDSYNITNLAVGFTRDSWSVDLFLDNVTDERAELYRNDTDRDRRVTTNRPRTLGIRFSQKF